MTKTGNFITTDWYDGPLRSLAVVTTDDDERLVEVATELYWIEKGDGSRPMHMVEFERGTDVHVRFNREELVKMLALIDGKPIEDFWEDMRMSIVEGKDGGE